MDGGQLGRHLVLGRQADKNRLVMTDVSDALGGSEAVVVYTWQESWIWQGNEQGELGEGAYADRGKRPKEKSRGTCRQDWTEDLE